jgi:hypothetical protein
MRSYAMLTQQKPDWPANPFLQAEAIDPTPLLKRVRERLVHLRQGTDVVSYGALEMAREAQPKETRPIFRRFTERASSRAVIQRERAREVMAAG